MGKEKLTFTPHVDGGDYVVVTNAAKIVVTGNKLTDGNLQPLRISRRNKRKKTRRNLRKKTRRTTNASC